MVAGASLSCLLCPFATGFWTAAEAASERAAGTPSPRMLVTAAPTTRKLVAAAPTTRKQVNAIRVVARVNQLSVFRRCINAHFAENWALIMAKPCRRGGGGLI